MGYLNHSDDGETIPYRHESCEIPCEILERLKQKLSGWRLRAILTPPVKNKSVTELFRDACSMSQAGITDEDQEIVLRARFGDYYRLIEDREFTNAITNARAKVEGGVSCESLRRFPKRNDAQRSNVLSQALANALARLKQASPIRDPHLLPTGKVIDLIFGGEDPLLCLSTATKCAYTEPRSFFLGKEHYYNFVVPSPMSARYGHTKSEGRITVRSLENVGPRMHVVVEFDDGTLDEQAGLLLHLSKFGFPLKMVVFSGKKSLHGWFYVRGFADAQLEQFLRYAAWIGADTATFSPVQLVRLPNVERESGRLQEVFYLDPVGPQPSATPLLVSASRSEAINSLQLP